MIRAAGLVVCCNYLLKKKKKRREIPILNIAQVYMVYCPNMITLQNQTYEYVHVGSYKSSVHKLSLKIVHRDQPCYLHCCTIFFLSIKVTFWHCLFNSFTTS